MPRQRWKPGSVVKIHLERDKWGYGQLLGTGLVVFFDLFDDGQSIASDVALHSDLFTLWVMKYAVTQGDWPIIGAAPIADAVNQKPIFFRENPFTGAVLLTADGREETAGSVSDTERLERLAVWEPEHVADRLRDHSNGVSNQWVEQLRYGLLSRYVASSVH